MIFHDGRPRYSGEEAMLHSSLEANDSYSWRRLPGQLKYVREQEL